MRHDSPKWKSDTGSIHEQPFVQRRIKGARVCKLLTWSPSTSDHETLFVKRRCLCVCLSFFVHAVVFGRFPFPVGMTVWVDGCGEPPLHEMLRKAIPSFFDLTGCAYASMFLFATRHVTGWLNKRAERRTGGTWRGEGKQSEQIWEQGETCLVTA